MCHFVGMNSTLKLKREAVLTQVVLRDEPSAGGAPVVAPELDPGVQFNRHLEFKA